MVQEVKETAAHLQEQGTKVVETVNKFGQVAAEKLQNDKEIKEIVTSFEKTANEAKATALKEYEAVPEDDDEVTGNLEGVVAS